MNKEVGLSANDHGGRAGWFRVAAGFSALAAVGSGYQSWAVSHPSVTATVVYAPPLGGAIAIAAVLFASASIFAMRHKAIAGLCLVIGYAIPTATLYAQQATIIPPSLLVVVSMVALIIATRQAAIAKDPAA